jgi:hypothetical protein
LGWLKKKGGLCNNRKVFFFLTDLKVHARLIHLNVIFLNEKVSSVMWLLMDKAFSLRNNIETIMFKKFVNLIKEMLCEAGNEKLNF